VPEESSGSADPARVLERLMAYMVGIPPEEVGHLIESFVSEGGTTDPSTLFRFLSSQGRRYAVLWAVLPCSEVISLLCAAVLGPGKEVLHSGVVSVPLSGDSGAFRLWNRVLEMASGGALPAAPERASESDLATARQLVRPLERKLWPLWIPRFAAEMETLASERPEREEMDLVEDGAVTIRLSLDVSREIREETGRGLNLSALRWARVSLPELRDLGLGIGRLQSALDDYVEAAAGVPREESPSDVPGNRVFERFPAVDPLKGIPLSDLRPGDPILLDRRGRDPEPGRIFMIRILRDGHYEVHGSLSEVPDTFFRFVVPGDIKIRVPSAEVPERGGSLLPLWGLISLGGLLLLVALLLLLR
jgi:hypothetical protein